MVGVDKKPSYGADTVSQVLDSLGVVIERESLGWGSAKCPMHEDESPSFAIHMEDGGWICRGECGSNADLAVLVERCTGEAATDVRHRLIHHMALSPEALEAALSPATEAPEDPEDYEGLFYSRGVIPNYFLRRGFTVETAKRWGVGWHEEHRAVAIPVTVGGDLQGLIYRTLDGIPAKYLYSKGFDKSASLFGLDMVEPEVEEVALVEGSLDCMWLDQCGIPAIAQLGSSLSDQQAEIILRRFRRVVLAFDADPAGYKAGIRAAKMLAPKIDLFRVRLPPGRKDVQECGPEEVRTTFSNKINLWLDPY